MLDQNHKGKIKNEKCNGEWSSSATILTLFKSQE